MAFFYEENDPNVLFESGTEVDPSSDSDFWSDVQEGCYDLSNEVGQATNWMYDEIADKAQVPDPFADTIGDFVGDVVEENWSNVCDLPENLYNDVTQAVEWANDKIDDAFVDASEKSEDSFSTPDFSTPDFSTSDFSSPDFSSPDFSSTSGGSSFDSGGGDYDDGGGSGDSSSDD